MFLRRRRLFAQPLRPQSFDVTSIARAQSLIEVADALSRSLSKLKFKPPVAHVYNPLVYARQVHAQYCERYGATKKSVLFVGMNPGPFGMMQTGVPFGEVSAVRDWLKLDGEITQPESQHQKRPITGWKTTRSEVSGARLWGWAQTRFGTPNRFFKQAFVLNYCPLAFLEASGKNRTPDALPRRERAPLEALCDEALARSIELLAPKTVLGVGTFAEARIKNVVSDPKIVVGRISHPSPASPAANKGWAALIESELAAQGVKLNR